MIQNCLFVMLGGAVGALLRYGISRLMAGVTLLSMPLGTLLVNIAGSFLLGWLTGIAQVHSNASRPLMLMLTVGLCGAFTTFSTFSAENIKLLENGQFFSTLLYTAASIFLGFLLFWFGKSLAS